MDGLSVVVFFLIVLMDDQVVGLVVNGVKVVVIYFGCDCEENVKVWQSFKLGEVKFFYMLLECMMIGCMLVVLDGL